MFLNLEEYHEDCCSHTNIHTEGKTDQVEVTQLPATEKEKMAEQISDFKKVKSKLYAEIEIWDDTVLAKKMDTITMEVTDFTRCKGPLKHTTDVICAAKIMSGSRINVLTQQLINHGPDPSCTQDVLTYLEQIKFFSHQMKNFQSS